MLALFCEDVNYTKETLANGTIICINDDHRFGTDAMLLSHFCNLKRNEVVCDLGTGCGIMPLRFYDSGHRGICTAVELSTDAIELLKTSLALNNITTILPICRDMKEFEQDILCDVISCNPPYFTGGLKPENATKLNARFEEKCTIQDVCNTAAFFLRDGGRLCVCQRPERLTDVLCAMRLAKIEPKVIRFVKQKRNTKPWLLLIEGQKNRKSGIKVLPDLIMQGAGGKKSAELLKIYEGIHK